MFALYQFVLKGLLPLVFFGGAAPVALLLLLGCTVRVAPARKGEEPLLALVSQRVTATVRREVLQLVRLSTEHEALLTTPEHPFAMPGSGWISAGRLVSGDRMVSERFGAVRLLSARNELAEQPIPVFNLSVAPSHSYFVGTGRVLVHNTRCKPSTVESREETIERLNRERDAINGELAPLRRTMPMTAAVEARITRLTNQRDRLQHQIDGLRAVQRKQQRQGGSTAGKNKRAWQIAEAQGSAAREALETARKELEELASRSPSPRDAKAFAARKAKLERQVRVLEAHYDRTNRIRSWLRELMALEDGASAADAEGQARERRAEELRAMLGPERERARHFKHYRKKVADPQWRKARAAYDRNVKRRLLRTRAYLADTERSRDSLELLEEELASRNQEAPSERRDARIQELSKLIDTMKKLVDLRRQRSRIANWRVRARRAREKRIAEGGDPSELDKKLEQLEQQAKALGVEALRLRVEELLLGRLAGASWARLSGPVDHARLREFERQLAEGFPDDQQLGVIGRALDELELNRNEFRDAVTREAAEVDAVLSEREELTESRRSPERDAAFESSFTRLQHELREERAAVEAALGALANEHAQIQTSQAGPSRGPSWQERLRAIQEEQVQLLAQWRTRLQERLESARRQLSLLQGVPALRDDEIESELGREIALLEHELQNIGR